MPDAKSFVPKHYVPPEVSTANFSGTYTLNKTLSDSSDAVLKMQGVGWLVRQAVKYSTITVTMKDYVDEEGVRHVDVEQVSTGGIRNEEERPVDWTWREKVDSIWGKLRGRTRFVKLSEVEDAYLKSGWDKGCQDGEVLEGMIESLADTWTAQQIWGFAEVNGERKHVRRVLTSKGKEEHRIRLVYDWKAQLPQRKEGENGTVTATTTVR